MLRMNVTKIHAGKSHPRLEDLFSADEAKKGVPRELCYGCSKSLVLSTGHLHTGPRCPRLPELMGAWRLVTDTQAPAELSRAVLRSSVVLVPGWC